MPYRTALVTNTVHNGSLRWCWWRWITTKVRSMLTGACQTSTMNLYIGLNEACRVTLLTLTLGIRSAEVAHSSGFLSRHLGIFLLLNTLNTLHKVNQLLKRPTRGHHLQCWDLKTCSQTVDEVATGKSTPLYELQGTARQWLKPSLISGNEWTTLLDTGKLISLPIFRVCRTYFSGQTA